jgi:spectrin alpha
LDHLAALAARRKAKLMDNSAYLQFMWKADVVESWIADKETHVRSEEFGRDLSTVQTLLTKQETFDAGEKQFRVNVFPSLFNSCRRIRVLASGYFEFLKAI